jgi:glucosamine-6-phosphate deaminase
MKIAVYSNSRDADIAGAAILREEILSNVHAKIGFATGSSPVGIYKKLVEDFNEGIISFKHISAYNLDEYVGLSRNHSESFAFFMWEHLFKYLDIMPENIHIPAGDANSPEQEVIRYENLLREAGQLDIQILGIGLNGHIGFNEPGSHLSQETHLVKLTDDTKAANEKWFKSWADVPNYAITIGLGTILKAKKIVFIACGKHKGAIIKEAFTGNLTTNCPASLLQLHPDVTILLDSDSAFELTGDQKPPFLDIGAKRLEFTYF